MSKLVHLCTKCPHPQNHHQRIGGGEACTGCPYCRAAGFVGDPEPTIVETFTHPGSQPEPLFEPGTTRNPGGAHAERLCGCEACRAAYARDVG